MKPVLKNLLIMLTLPSYDWTPEQLHAFKDFENQMEKVVIPEIVETMKKRAVLAAENRHRVLF